MGLQIKAFERLTRLKVAFDEEDDPVDPKTGERLVYSLCVFVTMPDRAEGLEDQGFYKAENSMRFSAGSYGGYNYWRDALARMVGYAPAPIEVIPADEVRFPYYHGAIAAGSGPFFELIHFSDCHGTIGPVVSVKLARDFAEWEERARQYEAANSNLAGFFFSQYQLWNKAFQMAANGGAVDFR